MKSICLGHANPSITPLDVVGNLPFDHIFLMRILQTSHITSDHAVL
jgi:hypothetical protein